jgi:3-oxo-5-alpha-steroid 4-dehydrogenase 1
MNERALFDAVLHGSLVVTLITAAYLSFATAPYGRHARKGYGWSVSNGLGWVLMEAPAALVPLLLTLVSDRRTILSWVFLAIWELHYLYRAFVYPLRIRGRGASMPVLVVLAGACFNVINGYLNFRYLAVFGPSYEAAWLIDPRFVGGCLLFVGGLSINRQADRILLGLRQPGETGYKIPTGGLYDYISCPNYFGEMVQWAGWALLTWSLPGLFFALFTAANLLPRALAHHRDYRRRFPQYPPERRAVFPFML